MATLLNKEVKITNSKLIQWADNNDVPMDKLDKLKITQVIDLICACSELTHEDIFTELDKDMGFATTIVETLNNSLEIKAGGEPGKKTARPVKK